MLGCGSIPRYVITLSIKDGIPYFLDASQDCTYRIKDPRKMIVHNDESELLFKFISTLIINCNLKECLKIINCLINNSLGIPMEEESLMIKNTRELCMQNEDIFENFYDENQELYNEISHELLKMKKNPFATK